MAKQKTKRKVKKRASSNVVSKSRKKTPGTRKATKKAGKPRAKDPKRVEAARLGIRRKREREEYEKRSKAAKLGHERKRKERAKRVAAAQLGWERKREREEKEKRAAASRLGWERKWKREGRKVKPARKGPPAVQPRKPPKVKSKAPPKPKPKERPRGTPEGERQVMLERLEAAKVLLPDAAILGPVINADNTVDSELLVYIPRGKSVRDLSLEIEDALRPPRGQWFNVGIRVPPNHAIANPEEYERALGLIQIQMYSRRSRYAGPAWDDWREEMLPQIEKGTKGWRKPEQLFIRLFWSPDDSRPDY